MRYHVDLHEAFYKAEDYKPVYGDRKIYTEIFVNPSLKEYNDLLHEAGVVRGVLTRKSANLYVVDGENIIHEDLLKMIDEVTFNSLWYMRAETLKEYLCVISLGERKFVPADSYTDKPYQAIEDRYQKLYESVLKKNNAIYSL